MKLIIFIDTKEASQQSEDTGKGYDIIAKKIAEEIRKIGPSDKIQSWSHTLSTNVIELDTKWTGSKLITNLKRIENFRGCAGIWAVYDPVREVEEAVQYHDFFKAYSLGVALLELHANNILEKSIGKSKFENIGKEKIVKMGVRTKIILLYALGIIEPKSFQNIIQIIKVRNESIVHSQDMNKIWEEKNLSSITQNLEVILSCIKTLGKLDSTSKSRGIMKLWNC
jgi:hypothetical protein